MKPAITSRRVHSLRWRLLAAIGAIVLTTWLLTGWFSYTKAQHEAEELMDGSLAQTARLLLAITHDNEDDLADIVRGGVDFAFGFGRCAGGLAPRAPAFDPIQERLAAPPSPKEKLQERPAVPTCGDFLTPSWPTSRCGRCVRPP